MTLNLLEYDTLRRIRIAAENMAQNMVSGEQFAELYRAFDMMVINHDRMERDRDLWRRESDDWKRKYDSMADNRDAFVAFSKDLERWGDGLSRQLDETRLRAEKAEAEVAALKAALAQGGQG